MYLQIRKLIRKHFDLVDVVQQIVTLLYLAHKKFIANKDDVGQTFGLVNVANCLPHLYGSFAIIDIRELVVHQIQACDGHNLLDKSLVPPQYFGICIGRWSLFGSVYNIPKVHGRQNHLHFKFLKAKSLSLELFHDSRPFAFMLCHLQLEE